MRIFNNANTIVSDIIVLDKELTLKEIELYSKYDIKPKNVVSDINQPHSIVKRGEDGMVRGLIDFGYEMKGTLKYQSNIVADCIYIGKTSDNLFKLYISTVSKAWTKGTDVPDSSFKEFSYKYLREG